MRGEIRIKIRIRITKEKWRKKRELRPSFLPRVVDDLNPNAAKAAEAS
jgi:hypothetical protein